MNIDLRLSLVVELTSLWIDAFSAEGVEEQLKYFSSHYLSEVLLVVSWGK